MFIVYLLFIICLGIENTMDVRVSVMGTHFMALKWSFNCTERIGFVDGYHINYCPSNPKNSSDCNGKIVFGLKTKRMNGFSIR